MQIDISKKRPVGRRVTIPGNRKKQTGISFTALVIIAAAAFFIDCFGQAVLGIGNIWVYQLLRFIGQIAAPIACFLAAKLFCGTRNIKNLFILGVILLAVSHVAFVYFNHEEFTLLRGTSFMLPVFLGCAALFVKDMTTIDSNMRTVMIFLLCLLAWFGSGGSVCAVWVFLLGSDLERSLKTKIFLFSWVLIFVIGLIYSVIEGRWYMELYRLGNLAALPLIMRYKEDREYPAWRYGCTLIYPVIMGAAAGAERIINS